VRSTFASAAVIPVVEQEVTRAREAGIGTSAIPYLVEQRVDRGIDSDGTPVSPTQSKPLSDAPRRVSRGAEALAEREMSTDPDLLSDTGVRHLRVEVQEHSSGRWKRVRFGAMPSNMVHIYS
jgi:hypothetical protein